MVLQETVFTVVFITEVVIHLLYNVTFDCVITRYFVLGFKFCFKVIYTFSLFLLFFCIYFIFFIFLLEL